jgi:hypothetical protein
MDDSTEEMDVSYAEGVERTVNGIHELHIGDTMNFNRVKTPSSVLSANGSVLNGDRCPSRAQILLDSDRDFPSLRPSCLGAHAYSSQLLTSTPFGRDHDNDNGRNGFINHHNYHHLSSYSQPGSPAPSLFNGETENVSVFSEPIHRPFFFRPPSPQHLNSTFLERHSSTSDDSHLTSPSMVFAARRTARDETVVARSVMNGTCGRLSQNSSCDGVEKASQTELSLEATSRVTSVSTGVFVGRATRALGFVVSTSLLFNFFLVVVLVSHEQIINTYQKLFS